jgi:hypothetical protein
MRRKKNIEIYFILYLAALILLITKKDDQSVIDPTKEDSSGFGFILQPLKTNLNCKLLVDSLGVSIASIDSSNTIYYHGDVEDVRFEFIVEDQSINQRVSLTADNSNSNPFFSVEENPGNKSASFLWRPRLSERINKSYLVTVIAVAKSAGDGNSDHLKELTQQTQFSLNVLYSDERYGSNPIMIASNDSVPGSMIQQPQIQYVNTYNGEIKINVLNKVINKMGGERWENEVLLYGADPQTELLGEPVVTPSKQSAIKGGYARVEGIRNNKIILSGITPKSGSMKVTISLTVKSNLKEYSTDFTVQPFSVGPPKYERRMYPEITYEIDPKLPFAAGVETKAMIKYGSQVIARSDQGGKFSYTPYLSDTGKVLSFERYMNGALVGQKYEIIIMNYADPEIRSVIYDGGNMVKIVTQSYGYINGKVNYVDLEVEGNVRVNEDRGSTPQGRQNLTHMQTFFCRRTDSQEFKFRAVDQRGRKSQQKSYRFDN